MITDIEQAAEKYADNCSYPQPGKEHFKTTYWIQHNIAVDAFKAGAEWQQSRQPEMISIDLVLSILRENYNACKNLTDEDKIRSAQETVNETYEDLIEIFDYKKQKTIPAKTDSNPLAFYSPVNPKLQSQQPKEAIQEMRRALKCLYLEVDSSIADDLTKRFEATLKNNP